jgi:cytoskeletal protein CcmA (bactofilin family)
MGWGKRKQDQIGETATTVSLPALDEPQAPEVVLAATASCLGPTLQLKGELQAREDVRIDGVLEGSVRVTDHCVVIGQNGRIQADITARSVTVEGQVMGNVTALDRVEVTGTGTVLGDIRAARVVLAEGARFKGTIDMGPTPGAVGEAEAAVATAKAAIDTGLNALFGSETARV